MQEEHFWYRGRHRFLRYAVRRHLQPARAAGSGLRIIDLGGGCGGWLAYLLKNPSFAVAEAALADSSLTALSLARGVVPPFVDRYHVDLMNLEWIDRWDAAFLLDVLEHFPDDRAALQRVCKALAPGGYLFVTVPALSCFWSYNDELVQHRRRYAKRDLARLAAHCGLNLLAARYFMFFLSPFLLAARWIVRPRPAEMSQHDRRRLFERTHAVPHPFVNRLLAGLCACETPLGHALSFPFGTSLLAVLRKEP